MFMDNLRAKLITCHRIANMKNRKCVICMNCCFVQLLTYLRLEICMDFPSLRLETRLKYPVVVRKNNPKKAQFILQQLTKTGNKIIYMSCLNKYKCKCMYNFKINLSDLTTDRRRKSSSRIPDPSKHFSIWLPQSSPLQFATVSSGFYKIRR